jgi:hypothetical protein
MKAEPESPPLAAQAPSPIKTAPILLLGLLAFALASMLAWLEHRADMASYSAAGSNSGFAPAYETNPWMLEVPDQEFMSFDVFCYLPLQNYPSNGSYSCYGKWAHQHR